MLAGREGKRATAIVSARSKTEAMQARMEAFFDGGLSEPRGARLELT